MTEKAARGTTEVLLGLKRLVEGDQRAIFRDENGAQTPEGLAELRSLEEIRRAIDKVLPVSTDEQ